MMEKLNELKELKEIDYSDIPIGYKVIIMSLIESAEAAEAKAKNLNDGWLNAIAERDKARTEQGKLEAARSVRDSWKERAWTAEEKLAELEKQKPVAYLNWHQGFLSPDDCEDYLVVASNGDKSCDGSKAFPVFTRPAPAADLGWVSCSDKLPDNLPGKWSEPVAAVSNLGDVFQLSCMDGYWQRTKAFLESDATEVVKWIYINENKS